MMEVVWMVQIAVVAYAPRVLGSCIAEMDLAVCVQLPLGIEPGVAAGSEAYIVTMNVRADWVNTLFETSIRQGRKLVQKKKLTQLHPQRHAYPMHEAAG